MKSLARIIATAAFSVIFVGAPLIAQDISVDYDHNFQFNQIKSYSWGKVQANDVKVEPRITMAIDRVLQGYGFKESAKNKKGDVIVTAIEANSPQLYAAFYRGMSSEATPLDWHRGWGGGGFSDGVTSLRQVHAGTFVVDIYNGATGKLIWRGVAAEAVPAKETASEQKPPYGYNTLDPANVDKTINSMFAKYPPRNGGYIPPNNIPVKSSQSSVPVTSPN
jgi:uncharacterized protein DUF4136